MPNHSAVDSQWTTDHPEFYIQKPSSGSWNAADFISWAGHNYAFGADPYDSPWTDTCQYNYWSQPLRDAMAQSLLTVASFADMARVDMAMLVLNDVIAYKWGSIMAANGFSRPSTEFWADAIGQAKAKFPGFEVMAESYNYGITNPSEAQLLVRGRPVVCSAGCCVL